MASFNFISTCSSTIFSFPRPCKNFKLSSGFPSKISQVVNGFGSNLPLVRMNSKLIPSRNNISSGIKSSLICEKDDLFSCPTQGFSSIPEAIEDIRQGKMVVVVDDEDRENEGDLIMAAQFATPEAMAFIVKHGTGIICVSMKAEALDRLELPLMVNTKDNEEKLGVAFTLTADAKDGTSTGVSAQDRATTILALASKESIATDFNRPGHIFPLKYKEGGVLKRNGHTEASLDLVMLAGLDQVAVLCEIVDDDGSMARLPNLLHFAKHYNLKIVSIFDL